MIFFLEDFEENYRCHINTKTASKRKPKLFQRQHPISCVTPCLTFTFKLRHFSNIWRSAARLGFVQHAGKSHETHFQRSYSGGEVETGFIFYFNWQKRNVLLLHKVCLCFTVRSHMCFSVRWIMMPEDFSLAH